MRHSDAGLAIPDFPTSYGHWLPPLDSMRHFAAGDPSVWHEPGTEPVTLFQIWINFAHRVGAVLVCATVIALAAKIFLAAATARKRSSGPLL